MALATDKEKSRAISARDAKKAAIILGVPVVGLGLFYLYTLLFDFAGNQ